MTPDGYDGYLATWRGEAYEASPDGASVRLYRATPAEGFGEVGPGRYARVVPIAEVTAFGYARVLCTWRGEPFLVLGEHQGWLRIEYTGGKAPVAHRLGLEEFEYGVYQGWVPADEVTDRREHRA